MVENDVPESQARFISRGYFTLHAWIQNKNASKKDT